MSQQPQQDGRSPATSGPEGGLPRKQDSSRRPPQIQPRDTGIRLRQQAVVGSAAAVAGAPAVNQPAVYLLTGAQAAAPLHGVQQRPMRPNLRRQVMVASSEAQVCAPIELASVLTRTGTQAALVPPKRPTALPARYATLAGASGAQVTSKPNRYSWAQMQQWQDGERAHLPGQQQQSQQQQQQQRHHHHHFSSPFSSAASRVLVVNPMQIVNLSEHTKSRLIKIIEALKRFSEQWFSHVLLLLFLAVYACFGAYIFISFEAPTEQWEKQLIIEARLQLVNESWTEATGGSRNQQDFSDYFRSRLEDYERLLNRACASGMTSSSLENQWTFWGALFYSMTVFTTIGYGHLTPITFAGRVATMVYAIFGIPILLMVLADLGKLLTRIIKYAFKKFRYLYNKLLRRKSSMRTRKLIRDNTSQYIGVARSAFERGYATYIQPYNRFPATFAAHRRRRPSDEAVASLQSNPQILRPDGLDPTMSASAAPFSDLIVTPGRQTKPVSPEPPDENPKPQQQQQQQQQHQHHTTDNRHHSNPHHTHRAHSPAARVRKGSTAGLGKRPSSSKSTSGSVPRSSSLSAVAPPSEKSVASIQGVEGVQGDELERGGAKNKADSLSELPAAVNQAGTQLVDNQVLGTADVAVGETAAGEQDELVGDEEEDELEDEFDIPVSFALFLLVTYMMFGAVVFSIWEGWNFFDSLYFVFISMSTIGFGDLVPQHPKRMIGTFIYLLFGLALTSMCINVVQEKIHATFLRAKMQIGEKMGLDLEQIMADDYYGADGSSLVGDEATSEAASATNSWLAASGGGHHGGGDSHWPDDHAHPVEPPELQSGVKPSKSRDSIRSGSAGGGGGSKKRSVAGLPGHNNHSAGFGGSLRRKPSQKKISRQGTPSSFTEPAATNSPPASPAPVAHPAAQLHPPTPVAQPTQPIKAELRRQASELPEQLPTSLLLPELPHINQPVGVASPLRCEPLGQRTRLRPAAQVVKSLSSELRPDGAVAAVRSNFRPFSATASRATKGRSADSSRRSSVSQELEQLDDLIVALSKSPAAERFGPLLGIPASASARSSRSNSPLQRATSAASNNNQNNTMFNRRATSVTSRPTTPTSGALARKKISLGGSPVPSSSRLNLRDSEAALDELEAIKFSAV